ncbi:hypothetical protein OAS19_00255 [Altererythrobacter sp.]|nr:hypothetical protein [Altererythrobacter sp.]
MSIAGWLILLIAAFGTAAAAKISWKHAAGQQPCPLLGPVPICYLVFAGYAAMMLSVIAHNLLLFVGGIFPVFAFAAAGTFGELVLKKEVCPRTAGGTPQCFFSFAVSLILAALGFILFSGVQW